MKVWIIFVNFLKILKLKDKIYVLSQVGRRWSSSRSELRACGSSNIYCKLIYELFLKWPFMYELKIFIEKLIFKFHDRKYFEKGSVDRTWFQSSQVIFTLQNRIIWKKRQKFKIFFVFIHVIIFYFVIYVWWIHYYTNISKLIWNMTHCLRLSKYFNEILLINKALFWLVVLI